MGVGKAISKVVGVGGSVFGTAMMIGMPIMSYKEERNEGHGVITSAVKSIAETAFYMSPIGDKVMIAQMVGGLAKAGLNAGITNASISGSQYHAQFGGNFSLSQNGYTMRQRGLNAIQTSNAIRGQTLGNEARDYHRGHFYI